MFSNVKVPIKEAEIRSIFSYNMMFNFLWYTIIQYVYEINDEPVRNIDLQNLTADDIQSIVFKNVIMPYQLIYCLLVLMQECKDGATNATLIPEETKVLINNIYNAFSKAILTNGCFHEEYLTHQNRQFIPAEELRDSTYTETINFTVHDIEATLWLRLKQFYRWQYQLSRQKQRAAPNSASAYYSDYKSQAASPDHARLVAANAAIDQYRDRRRISSRDTGTKETSLFRMSASQYLLLSGQTIYKASIPVANGKAIQKKKLRHGWMLQRDTYGDYVATGEQQLLGTSKTIVKATEPTSRKIEKDTTAINAEIWQLLYGYTTETTEIRTRQDNQYTARSCNFSIPYLEGETLDKIIDRGGLDPHRALEWFIQIVEAVNFLHQHGYAHRDLKPENIMIVNGQAMLVDFGFSVKLDDIEGMQRICGSTCYAAPEIFNNEFCVASETYALALLGASLIFSESALDEHEDLFEDLIRVQSKNVFGQEDLSKLSGIEILSLAKNVNFSLLPRLANLQHCSGYLTITNTEPAFKDLAPILQTMSALEPADRGELDTQLIALRAVAKPSKKLSP